MFVNTCSSNSQPNSPNIVWFSKTYTLCQNICLEFSGFECNRFVYETHWELREIRRKLYKLFFFLEIYLCAPAGFQYLWRWTINTVLKAAVLSTLLPLIICTCCKCDCDTRVHLAFINCEVLSTPNPFRTGALRV